MMMKGMKKTKKNNFYQEVLNFKSSTLKICFLLHSC